MSKVQDYINTAYAYCKFNELWIKIADLFASMSGSAGGRMFTRILSSMTEMWWYRMNCMVDGFLGGNFYDVGYCAGKLFTTIFDMTLG